jgi:hypothetical protein
VGIRRYAVAVAVGVVAIAIAAVGAPMAASAASGWTIQPTPNPPGATQANLNGVSCASATACVGVGFALGSSGGTVTLAETWNGTSWATQATPNPTGSTGAVLDGVSCTSATACTAVGHYSNSAAATKTVAEAWDGTTWVIQHTPNPVGTTNAVLSGVSCSSAAACTAVGHYSTSSNTVTLAEAWNGTKWVIQHTPVPSGMPLSELLGVSCTSGVACTAVGFSLDSSNHDVALAEAWNGTKWVIQHTPVPLGTTSAVLRGVSCSSSTACTAVGDDIGSSVFVTLAERWNGTKWAVQKTPNPAATTIGSFLTGVSCTSSTACTAVGYNNLIPPGSLTVAEAWNGTKWVIEPTPNPAGAQQTYLNGVSCTSPTVCTAAGYANIGSSSDALAEAHS